MRTDGRVEHDEAFRIPVAYMIVGWENNRRAIVDLYRNAEKFVHWVLDREIPPISSGLDWLSKEIFSARQRGITLKTLTDITPENLPACKHILTRLDELRHLDGIKTVFGYSDFEVLEMVTSITPKEEKTSQFIQSDSESMVADRKLIFEALWSKAIPGQRRIDELEENDEAILRKVSGETQIDRIYACKDCNQTFIYWSDADGHRGLAGHNNFYEYPIG